MRFFFTVPSLWLIVGNVCSGLDSDWENSVEYQNVTPLDAFVGRAHQVMNNAIRKILPSRVGCHPDLKLDEKGPEECYGFIVGAPGGTILDQLTNGSKRLKHELVKPDISLVTGLYYAFPDKKSVDDLLELDNNYLMGVLESDPECEVLGSEPVALGETVMGPGRIIITETHLEAVGNSTVIRYNGRYATPGIIALGGFEVNLNFEQTESHTSASSSALGQTFDVPVTSSCTPYLVHFSLICKRVRARFTFGNSNLKEPAFYHHDLTTTKDDSLLLPISHDHNEFFTAVVGCVDFHSDN